MISGCRDQLTHRPREKFSLQDLIPPWPAGNGTPTKGRWAWVITMMLRSRCRQPKNFRGRTYTPSHPTPGEETGLRSRTMGVVSIQLALQKNYLLQDLYPPSAARLHKTRTERRRQATI